MEREELDLIFEDKNAKWEGDNAMQGLEILRKYLKPDKPQRLIQGANHDVIYSLDIDEVLEAGLTTEDAEKLASLNWMLGDSYWTESFACFV